MIAHLSRRAIAAGLVAACAAPVGAKGTQQARTLRDDGDRLPDHATLWDRMPLPFTPSEAWHLLTPEAQAEIGAAVIGMALADYVSGDMHMDEADHFLDGDLRSDCIGARDGFTGAIEDRLWALFPDLYGPDSDHPQWALDAGMVLPLGAELPEPRPAPMPAPDPILAAIAVADAARRAHQGIFDDGLDEDDPAQMARLDVLQDADHEAFVALAAVIPTTNDGDVALADFYLRMLDDQDGRVIECLEHLRDVLAGGVS